MFIRGVVKKINYQKNGNVIFKMVDSIVGKGDELPVGAESEVGNFIQVKGFFDGLIEGSEVEIEGNFKINNYKPNNVFAKKQTPQLEFIAKQIEQLINGNEDIVIKNFFIKNVPFIGDKTADLIFKKFSGEEIIEILKEESGIKELINIKGIGKLKATKIYEGWSQFSEQREVLLKLSSYGIGVSLGLKIYELYKENTIKKIEENPYNLTKIRGIGFKKAEKIAIEYFNIPKDSLFRYVAMIEYFMNKISDIGDTIFSYEDLKKEIKDYLLNDSFEYKETIDEILNKGINEGIKEGRIVKINSNIYMLKYLQNIEQYLYEEITKRKDITYDFNINLNSIENFNKLNNEQKIMVENTLKRNLTINVGPAGSGKTFTTKVIIDGFKKIFGKDFSLCIIAPTNKAVKRVQEVNGKDIESKTIHKLLGLRKGGIEPLYNKQNKLPYKIIMIDEAGMMGENIGELLLKAISDNTIIVFTGDYNQLSPVNSPGSLLYDLIESGYLQDNINSLKTIERVDKTGGEVGIGDVVSGINNIIANCSLILEGKYPQKTITTPTYLYDALDENYEEKIISNLIQIYNQMINKKINFNKDFQILTPIYNGTLGINNLNLVMSNYLNQKNSIQEINGKFFREGDKVYYNENNLEVGLSKGDTGIISKIDNVSKVFYIKFFDIEEEQKFSFMEVGDIYLGYAMSIHKAQGSEFPYVSMILNKSAFSLLNKNLLYTGYSRGKKIVNLMGDTMSIGIALNNVENSRNTLLFNLFKGTNFDDIELINDRSNNMISENERKFIQNKLRNIYIKGNNKEEYGLVKIKSSSREMYGFTYIFGSKEYFRELGIKEGIIIKSEEYDKISFDKKLIFIKIKKGIKEPGIPEKSKLNKNFNHRLIMIGEENENKKIEIFSKKRLSLK